MFGSHHTFGADLERWKCVTDWPLAIAALIFLFAYAWQVIGDLDGGLRTVTEWTMNVTWAIFLVDYVVSILLAHPRWRWFYTHLLDLAMVLLPMARPLRLLRLITLLRVLQRTAGAALRGKILVYVIGTVGLLVLVGSLAILDAERGQPGSSIETYGDAIWWSIVTITTVGYGDLTTATLTGRLVAVALMAGGITLISTVTGTLASWIVERIHQVDEDNQAATRAQFRELERKIDRLLAVQAASTEDTTDAVLAPAPQVAAEQASAPKTTAQAPAQKRQ
ncbi:two pore domain potassium channel family protein [Pseudoclavibacter sp. CFCC 13796]|uniref:potassium channel family protein n=1 Tax=Pseudoclavibacter sp. CFCC 13796 TaxID=2615179 RepID=UPI0013011BAA|nr:potassium channel family protein [Pseudoclavibacter sp. CFCC 13796]KAB1659892.1 two pore domain potassium channel family protein [Pseudoclavibacter sp. CFCC 13796]